MATPQALQDKLNYVNHVLKEMGKESDRSAAVLIVAEIEKSISALLEAFFLPPLKNSPRLLGTFSARIEAVYRLGFIPPEFRHDLNILRDIRNDFAHGGAGIKFSSDKIKSLCRNLLLAESVRQEKLEASKGKLGQKFIDDSRSRFMLTTTMLMAHLTLLQFRIQRTPQHWQKFFSPPVRMQGSNKSKES
jgi:DNA-binding MltR family transcriptional regulator